MTIWSKQPRHLVFAYTEIVASDGRILISVVLFVEIIHFYKDGSFTL